MGFLKRIFGRNKWEQVADEVDMGEPVWESVPYADPTPSMGVSQAPAELQPAAEPEAPPKFVPGVAPSTAPPPKFVPGAAPSATPPPRKSEAAPSATPPPRKSATAPTTPPPKFQPGVMQAGDDPATESPAEPETPAVPTIASDAPVAMSRAPEPTREVIIDTIDDDDKNMPEEFRGCRVIERTKPDGSVEIMYRGADGFAVDESTADFLISSYKDELATLTPKTAQPHPSGSYAVPAAVPTIEPRLMGGAPGPEPHVPTTDEVIDELGFDADLPPELRGARFVRRGSEFQYVTKGGARFSKDEAESMMEDWERSQAEKQPSAPLLIDELGIGNDLPPELRGAQFVNDGNEFLYITREGTRYSKDMAEGMMERWERDEADRAKASVPVSIPQPEVKVPWTATSDQPETAPVAVTAEPSGTLPKLTPPPSAATPPPAAEPEMVGSSIGDVLKKRAESGLLPAVIKSEPKLELEPEPEPGPGPAVATPAPSVPAAPTLTAPTAAPSAPTLTAPTPAPIGVDPRFPVRAVQAPQAPEDPTTEVQIDGGALAEAQAAAEQIRQRVLDDEDAAYQTDVPVSRLQQACQSEIDRKRTRHRFEHMLEQSARARETLVKTWTKSSDRKERDIAKDLDQDMMVLGLFNPMTMREIDLAEFLSVSRLRASERRRTIVTGELARRVAEQAPGELHQFCMTRAFVDRVAQTAMDSTDAIPKVIETVLSDRLKESVEMIVAEVTKRHGIWLPGLAERLVLRLSPLIRGLVKLAQA